MSVTQYKNISAPQAAIEEAVRLVQQHYSNKNAWFVGSRVNGDPGSDSDLDIAVETLPMRHKQNGTGCGMYVKDTITGIDIDITEDADGPVWVSESSQVRIQ